MHSVNLGIQSSFTPTLASLEHLLVDLPLASVVWNAGGQIIFCSRAAERLLGWLAEDLVGKTVVECPCFVPADQTAIAATIKQVLAGSTSAGALCPGTLHPNGSRLACRWLHSLTKDHAGNHYVISVIHETGHGLSADEEDLPGDYVDENLVDDLRILPFFSSLAMGFAKVDLDGNYIAVNDAYARMLGYTRSELLQMRVIDVWHPQDVPTGLAARAALKQTSQKKRFSFERRYINKNGKTVWLRVTGSNIKNRDGLTTGLFAFFEDINAQKIDEENLKNNIALLRLGSGIARIGGWVEFLDSSKEIYWSQDLFELLEYAGPPLKIEDLCTLFAARDAEVLLLAVNECKQTGKPFELELPFHTFEGNARWMCIAAEPEYDQEGSMIRLSGAIQDITKQQGERELRLQLSTRLVTSLESMTDAFYLLDHEWRTVYMNTEAERIMRFKKEEGLGKIIWERSPTLVDTPLYEGFHQAMLTNKVYHTEYYSKYLNDWIDLTAYPTSEGLAVYFHSTTVQRKLEHEISESEQRLKYVTQATLDAAWDWNLDDQQVWWSEGIEKLLGLGEKLNVKGHDFWANRIHPDDAKQLLHKFQLVELGAENAWEQRYRVRHQNGQYIYVEERGFSLKHADGKVRRLIGGIKNITEKVALEEQLLQTKRMDSIGKLTGGVAHDFNNLLTVILGNVDLLKSMLPDEPQLQSVTDAIANAAQRGADLTHRLLSFARRQALHPQRVNINLLVDKMEGLLKPALGEAIEIRILMDKDLQFVNVDASQLEDAILNLCLNSRDAMPEGGTLTVETSNMLLESPLSTRTAQLEPGAYVVLAISDSGTGIAPDVIEKIFEPFFTTKALGKGTGLGLSSVFGFIQQSNGHIIVGSELGSGTTIKICLPAFESGELNSPALPKSSVQPARGTETILVVEDDALVRDFVQLQLKALGYTVVCAGNGASALEIIKQRNDLDLVFTDVIMPGGLSGPQLAKATKAVRPHLKIMFTSGYTENLLPESELIDTGIVLLQKPYHSAELARKLRDFLDS